MLPIFSAYFKDAQIINWLHEFRASVAYLTKELEQLVSILLVNICVLLGRIKSLVLKTCFFDILVFAHFQKLPWLRRSREVVEEYLGFLGNLVSAQTVHLRPCLRMIVSHFVPRKPLFS